MAAAARRSEEKAAAARAAAAEALAAAEDSAAELEAVRKELKVIEREKAEIMSICEGLVAQLQGE